MADYTFPHQRIIKIHRERPEQNFLGIKNENWMSAAKDLKAQALMLYMYLAANSNNYEVALSPVAIQQEIGMPRSTFYDQFKKLVEKGYLVYSHGNTFEFYEIPQDVQKENAPAAFGQGYKKYTDDDNAFTEAVYGYPQGNREINTKYRQPNNLINTKTIEREEFVF